jgi:hypothetical protein
MANHMPASGSVISRGPSNVPDRRSAPLKGVQDGAAYSGRWRSSTHTVPAGRRISSLESGAQTAGSLIDAGLVDELRLILDPLLAGEGKALIAMTEHRRELELRKVQQLPEGRVSLVYGIG